MTAAQFPQRGELYAARLGAGEGSEQRGTRPVVVVSNDDFNRVMPVVSILPITRQRKERHVYPSEVLIRPGTGRLRSPSLVLAHQIRTIARVRLGRRIGRLDEAVAHEIDEAMRVHLGL